jgi:hypothetical protein
VVEFEVEADRPTGLSQSTVGVRDVNQFRELISEFSGGKRQVPRWQFETIDIAGLTGLEELGTRE